MRKLNILIRVSGGKAPKKELGYGHIFRSLHLAQNFRRHNILFLLEDYGGARKIIEKHGFDNIIKMKKCATLDYDIELSTKMIRENSIDVLILDSYRVQDRYLRELSKFTKTVLITDLRKINYSANLVVNGFIGFQNKKFTDKSGTRYLLGPRYQILNNKYSNNKSARKKKYDLLVTFGGFDENNITEIFLEEIIKFNGQLKVKIIHGPSSIKTIRIKQIEKKFNSFFTLVKTANMYKEIRNTRFGLCSGGITTYEFAVFGIPLGIIGQVKHQLITAKVWQRKNMAENMGLVNKNTYKKIHNFLKEIIENKSKTRKNIPKLVDGLGGRRVSHEILSLIN